MGHPLRRASFAILCAGWVSAIAWGGSRLWRYESAAGAAAHAPRIWPADAKLSRKKSLPNLVLLIHPKCPCSRATLGELSRLMTDCAGKLTTTVLMIRPDGVPDGWERTDLWNSAAAIPGVTVKSDRAGSDARFFGAETSGQALLYGPDGRLLFSGGITESRGHAGDNAGRSAIASLVLGLAQSAPDAPLLTTPVYGCPLFDKTSSGEKETTCHK